MISEPRGCKHIWREKHPTRNNRVVVVVVGGGGGGGGLNVN